METVDPEEQIEEMRKQEDQRIEIERRKLDRNNWTTWRDNPPETETEDDRERDREIRISSMKRRLSTRCARNYFGF